jgi:hypothetical protein
MWKRVLHSRWCHQSLCINRYHLPYVNTRTVSCFSGIDLENTTAGGWLEFGSLLKAAAKPGGVSSCFVMVQGRNVLHFSDLFDPHTLWTFDTKEEFAVSLTGTNLCTTPKLSKRSNQHELLMRFYVLRNVFSES